MSFVYLSNYKSKRVKTLNVNKRYVVLLDSDIFVLYLV